jgi:hypothetical protein
MSEAAMKAVKAAATETVKTAEAAKAPVKAAAMKAAAMKAVEAAAMKAPAAVVQRRRCRLCHTDAGSDRRREDGASDRLAHIAPPASPPERTYRRYEETPGRKKSSLSRNLKGALKTKTVRHMRVANQRACRAQIDLP